MMSRTTIGVAAAGLVGVVAYCVYFDRKRRSDPLFKQKLRESESSIDLCLNENKIEFK
jgi:import receptor subunit TOM20